MVQYRLRPHTAPEVEAQERRASGSMSFQRPLSGLCILSPICVPQCPQRRCPSYENSHIGPEPNLFGSLTHRKDISELLVILNDSNLRSQLRAGHKAQF